MQYSATRRDHESPDPELRLTQRHPTDFRRVGGFVNSRSTGQHVRPENGRARLKIGRGGLYPPAERESAMKEARPSKLNGRASCYGLSALAGRDKPAPTVMRLAHREFLLPSEAYPADRPAPPARARGTSVTVAARRADLSERTTGRVEPTISTGTASGMRVRLRLRERHDERAAAAPPRARPATNFVGGGSVGVDSARELGRSRFGAPSRGANLGRAWRAVRA